MSDRRRVLILGLKFNSNIPQDVRDGIADPDELNAKIRVSMDRAAAAGFDCDPFQIEAGNPEEGLKTVQQMLGATKYHGITFGGGLRLVPDNAVLFETLINLCRQLVAPGVPFMFVNSPVLIFDAIERNLIIPTKEEGCGFST